MKGVYVMKQVVVYKSHYGTTKQYAIWLAEALHADLFEHSKIKARDLQGYDVIIYGGGLYAGGISGFSLITKNFEKLKNKKLIVFTVGLAHPENPDNLKGIQKSTSGALPPQAKDHIKFYHLRGGMDYSQLGLIHRAMMAMLKKVLSKKNENELTEDDKGLLATYGKTVDFTDQSTLMPLINHVNTLTHS